MEAGTETNAIVIEYRDTDGILRRVLAPETADPSEGVPLSLPVDELYWHMPLDFRQRLVKELWAVGLVEPKDFLAAGAAERIRAALLSVVKHDVFDIQKFAKESMSHAE
jgi:hypothetical protein